jgi:hypothetical protein
MQRTKQESATADLGCQRLNHKLIGVTQQLADKPSQSIPTAHGGWFDTIGSYWLICRDRFGRRGDCGRSAPRNSERIAIHVGAGRWRRRLNLFHEAGGRWISVNETERTWHLRGMIIYDVTSAIKDRRSSAGRCMLSRTWRRERYFLPRTFAPSVPLLDLLRDGWIPFYGYPSGTPSNGYHY